MGQVGLRMIFFQIFINKKACLPLTDKPKNRGGRLTGV